MDIKPEIEVARAKGAANEYVMGCLSTAGKLLSHFIVCSTTD